LSAEAVRQIGSKSLGIIEFKSNMRIESRCRSLSRVYDSLQTSGSHMQFFLGRF
jgi:hypothetical protein